MLRPIITAIFVLLASQGSVISADDHAQNHTSAEAGHVVDSGHGGDSGHGTDSGHGSPSLIPMKSEEIAEQAPLAIWSFVVFMVLLSLAGKFGWKPIVKAMADRQNHMQACLEDTEKARNEAENLLRQYKSEMASASDKIKSMLDEARRDAQTTADSIINKAQAESESLKLRAERDISQAKDEALTEIWSKTAELSVQVAGKVLQTSLTPDDHSRLLDIATSQLPDQSSFGIRATTGSSS